MLDTTFPHAKPQMLYWNVQSEMDGEATVEITYFTSGISWSADYLCIANPAETRDGPRGLRPGVQQLRRGVRECPGAAGGGQDQPGGEDRPVGPHLAASKVAELAEERTSKVQGAKPSKSRWHEARGRAAARPPRGRAEKPKEIIKEGLSEYFIYTIEGTETIPNGWSKRMRSFEAADRPVQDPVPLPPGRNTATSWSACTC